MKVDRQIMTPQIFSKCLESKYQSIKSLISVTENIEETPAGQFLESVCAAVAQLYSSNLAGEVLKSMKEKFEGG